VIAPSGAEWYAGDAFRRGRAASSSVRCATARLVRLVFGPDGRIAGEERLLVDREKRVRDVRQGPTGRSTW
jgi:glucose/arabinose dehydrogenase